VSLVAGLLRGLLGGIEHTHELGRDLRLAGAGALHFGYAGDFGIVGGAHGFRVAAGGADQAGSSAFLVVEQGFEQMFRRNTLMEFAYGDRAGGLQEAFRAIGEFFQIHGLSLSRRHGHGCAPCRRRGWPLWHRCGVFPAGAQGWGKEALLFEKRSKNFGYGPHRAPRL
jgi:hypothetical protein